ncbi:MAG: 2-hydroxychromene-2-carboxylate isomerase [Alphaproteobacteria bacterium]|nr:2-hydroxychromene-2-carboxylate isomerase [Alphaproteobacteria bacterium]
MSNAFDFFFSFRSPYSYLALPQIEACIQRYGVEPRMRIVLPIAVRIPGFFKTVNPLWPPYLVRDTMRIAQMLSIPYRWPRPDPIVMDVASGEVAADQPYIYRVSRLGVAAAREGKGFEFVKQMATAIWSGEVDNWHEDERIVRALTDAGLDARSLMTKIEQDSADYDEEIARNQDDQVAAGHWGVPLFVYNGEPFFGQDRIEHLLWRMQQTRSSQT